MAFAITALALTACGAGDGQSKGATRLAASFVNSEAVSADAGPAAPEFASATTDKAMPAAYSVINLGSGEWAGFPAINARGHVGFSVYGAGAGGARAWFFNGDKLRDIGGLGGASAFVSGINNAGQIAGYADNAFGNARAFRWSLAGGMRDLGTLGGTLSSTALGINQQGSVVGYSDYSGSFLEPIHAFRWSESGGMRDLGTLANGTSVAEAINERGELAGYSDAAESTSHAFLWSPDGGMIDLGTLGGHDSYGMAVNNAGQVAGYAMAPDSPEFDYRGFVWSRATGMVDIGTLGGGGSSVWALADSGQVAGLADTPDDVQHAVSWTRRGGLVDLGSLGGPGDASVAIALNNHGVLVGWALMPGEAARYHAFVTREGRAMADLNLRIPHAPEGLELDTGLAVNDKGAIVASSNAGLVLLVPGLAGTDAPVLGPIGPIGPIGPLGPGSLGSDELPVMLGARLDLSAVFRDQNAGDTHRAHWSSSDACSSRPGKLSESGGKGVARLRHTFCQAGVTTISLTLADSGGRSTTVSRRVVVFDPDAPGVAGSGSLLSPRGASAGHAMHSGQARFRFAVQGKETFALSFHAGELGFQGSSASAPQFSAGGARFDGSGKLNGKPGYRYSVSIVAGVNGAGAANGGGGADGVAAALPRVRMRITHSGPGNSEIVDYDNGVRAQARLASSSTVGSAVPSGSILLGRRAR